MEKHTSNVDDIYLAALEREIAEERFAYLEVACAGNPELRQRVERLLEAQVRIGSFLEAPAPEICPTVNQPVTEKPGTQIGPYKLLQQIGEGGMGVVYMAEQTEPIARRVALKIIKPGMDSHQVIARFEAERQALAMMDHVNIARVLDAGTTPAGLPYFVMELVHGVPITQYCDDQRLTPRQRLELFVPVCQAIQHAHQKGIIHRDIKPSNVMVTLYDGRPVPKVIDFGVAKATEQKLTERTLFTQFGTMVGTLEYMSPEQAEMSALGADTRSDIFSLGVLLYELLTGSTPLSHQRLKEAAYGEVLRMIREEEPPKPSTRLSESGEALASISANRHTEPAKLTKLMRGELDWIVMKTLEKDRNRRYETANGFARDVQRYLNDEAVLACPPSAGYRFRKFARRNKSALAVAALILFFITLLGSGVGWAVRDRAAREAAANQQRQAREVEVARERQEREASIQAEVNLALKEAAQWQEEAKWPEALSATKRAEGLLGGGGSNEVRERVHQFRRDLDMVLRLEEIRAQRGGDFDDEAASQAYAQAFADFGIDVEALSPTEAAARIRSRSAIAVKMAGGLDYWAMVRRNQKNDPVRFSRLLEVARLADPDPWRSELRQLMGREDLIALRKLADSSDIAALPVESLQLMGNALIFGKDGPACVAWLRKAHRQYPGDGLISFDLAFHLNNLPSDDLIEVLRFAEAALAARPQSAAMYHFVGTVLNRLGRHDEAIACFRKAIELKPDFDWVHNDLGRALAAQGKLDEAIACYRGAIELNPTLSWLHVSLFSALVAQGKLDEAIACCRGAIELNPTWTWAHTNLVGVLQRQGRLDEAAAACREAIELDPKYAYVHNNHLGNALDKQGKLDEAAAAYREAIRLKPDDRTAHANLVGVLQRQGRLDEAAAAYREAIRLKPDDHLAHYYLGMVLGRQDKLDEAAAAYREAIRLKPDDHPAHANLVGVLQRQGRLDEAAAAYREAIRLKPDDHLAHYYLGMVLGRQDKLDEAAAAYREAIRLKPDDHPAHYNLGLTLESQQKPDEAIAVYRQGVERLPQAVGLHDRLAQVLRKQKRLEEAVASLRQAIHLNPKVNNYNFYISLGSVLNEQLKPKEAAEAFRQAIDIDPKNAAAYSHLAVTLRALEQNTEAKDLPDEARVKRWDEAVAHFTTAIEQSPNDASRWNERGDAYGWLGQKEKALADYTKASELNPKDPQSWLKRGSVYVQLGQRDKAIADYSKAIELNPDDANYWNIRGQAYERLRQWNQALADYIKASELSPKDPQHWLRRGSVYVQLGQHDKAIADYSKAIELKPDDVGGRNGRGSVYLSLGQFENALADFTKIIELNPKDPQHWLRRGSVYVQLGQRDKAAADYSKAIELKPDDVGGRNGRGGVYLSLGQFENALADFTKIIELQPKNTLFRLNRAAVYARMGQHDKAAADYSSVTELTPDDAWGWHVRAQAFQRLGQTEKALADYTKASELNPKHVLFWVNRGSLYVQLGQHDKAIADYSKAIELAPNVANHWHLRASAYERFGNHDKAIADYSKAIELQPHGSHYWHLRGLAHGRLGQWDQALADQTKAAELMPTSPVYGTSQGTAYAQLGQWDKAAAAFEHATTLAADYPVAWYFRALLELQRDDRGGYRQACARMLERFDEPASADAAYWTTWTCGVAPDAVADWTKPLKLAEQAHAADGKNYDMINQLGCVLYRAGRFPEAAQRLTEADAAFKETPSKRSTIVYNWFFQAMAQHRLGNTAEAASWLAKAVQEIDKPSPASAQDTPANSWNRRLTLQLLRREAEELLAEQSK